MPSYQTIADSNNGSGKETPISTSDEKPTTDDQTIEIPAAKVTRLEEFSKTATAAKASGAFHSTAGLLKRKFGEFTDNPEMTDAGRDQQLLGKVHRFVGTLRSVREVATDKFNRTRAEGTAICRKHGGRLLDVASDFVDDIKKLLK